MTENKDSLFVLTDKFKETVEYINSIEDSKFPLLLKRIIQKLHLQGESFFSPEEEEQLQNMMGLNASQLHLVLETSAYIYEQSAYNGVNPSNLVRELNSSGFEENKSMAFGKLWKDSGANYVETLRKRSFFPHILSNVDYRLHL